MGCALYCLRGPVLWAGVAAFAFCSWAAIMSVRAFERTSK